MTVTSAPKSMLGPNVATILVGLIAVIVWGTAPIGAADATARDGLGAILTGLFLKPFLIILAISGAVSILRSVHSGDQPEKALTLFGVPWLIGTVALVTYNPDATMSTGGDVGVFLPVVHALTLGVVVWVIKTFRHNKTIWRAERNAPRVAPAAEPAHPVASQSVDFETPNANTTRPATSTPRVSTDRMYRNRTFTRDSPAIAGVVFCAIAGLLYGFLSADVPFGADPLFVGFYATLWTIAITTVLAVGYLIYRLAHRSSNNNHPDAAAGTSGTAATAHPEPTRVQVVERLVRRKWVTIPAAVWVLSYLVVFTVRGGNLFTVGSSMAVGVGKGVLVALVLFAIVAAALILPGLIAERMSRIATLPDTCPQLLSQMHSWGEKREIHMVLLDRGRAKHCETCFKYFVRNR